MRIEQHQFIDWIYDYISSEDFPPAYLDAIRTIVSRLNNTKEEEDAILDFANRLRSNEFKPKEPQSSLAYELIVSETKDRLWVNASDGSSVGRFNVHSGMDIHRSVSEQVNGEPECLFCTHGKPSMYTWKFFRNHAFNSWGLTIPADCLNLLLD